MSVPVPMKTGGGSGDQMFVSQTNPPTVGWPLPSSCPLVMACDSLSPNLANVRPASPVPSFLRATRRVRDCAMDLVSSSNLLFIFFVPCYGSTFLAPAIIDLY